jgi:hypothetical protein
MPGPPSGSYLRVGGTERLAAILLRQTQQAAVTRPQTVEALYHEGPPAAEFRYISPG